MHLVWWRKWKINKMFQALSLNVKILLLSLVLALVASTSGSLCYKWQENKYENLLTQQTSASDKVLSAVKDAAAAQVAEQLAQRQIDEQVQAAKDVTNLKERASALKENDRLGKLVDAGKRLHVSAKCPNSGSSNDVSKTPANTGLDVGTTVELSTTAGRNVLAIRAGIIKDQAALKAFQGAANK